MFRKIKKKKPCFNRSSLNLENMGLLRNRFRYRGLMDDYLKMDAGELVMCEDMRYQGRILDDFFQGWGELFLQDGIIMRGEWNKGKLVRGEIFFEQIKMIRYVSLNLVKKKPEYFLSFSDRNENIKDGKEINFQEDDKTYFLKFSLS